MNVGVRKTSGLELLGLALLGGALLACGDPPVVPEDADTDSGTSDSDSGTDAGVVELCARDQDCDDDLFCNGVERCRPGEAGADARGCMSAASDRCEASQTCDEAADECVNDCGMEPDADGDGHDAVACGGGDCDDADPNVNPGVMEQCDMGGRDEDCEPSTLGPDADMDGYVSAMCCNRQLDGSLLCGTDCDDGNGEINPDAIEVCNGLDDNCDGALDPTIEDGDGDGWARCADLPEAMRDCNDSSATTYPGATELCDGLDNDCDGSVAGEDVDEDGFMATDVMCTGGARMGLPRTDCDDTDRGVAPDQPERCDAVDHDCDGTTDEAPAADSCPAIAETSFSCVSEACAVASCGMGFGDCDTSAANGCEQPLNTVTYCGSCGTSCSWECAGGSCSDPVRTVAGYDHTCALLAGGTIRCWGANDSGQLGTGLTSGTPSLRPDSLVRRILAPVGVGTLEGVTDVVSGIYFSCALVSAGQVLCWGADDVGQLGLRSIGTTSPYASVVGTSTPLTSVSSLSAGLFHACASRTDGTVSCWGGNGRGQVGATVDPQPNPTTVAGLVDVVSVSVGGEVSCAIVSGGEVWCWGKNSTGQLGRGSSGPDSTTPAPVVAVSGPGNLAGVDEVSVGPDHVCARIGDEVVCWGAGSHGELGNGTASGSGRPTYVLDGGARLSGVTSISAGFNFSCAAVGGGIQCWGRNNAGQLGDGTLNDRTTPVDVLREGGSPLRSGGPLVHSMVHSCVQSAANPVCWGLNAWGQLGNGGRMTRMGATDVLPPILP